MKRTMKRHATLASTAIGAAAALALAAPLAASAHVRVSPDQATPGSYATLTFRVPTESDTASTVKLEVDFPTTTPFTSVSYQPVAGWTTKVVTTKLATPVKTKDATITEAPTKVIWTADPGHGIAPGQFREFVVSAGIVPDTGSVMLPAHQTYSDGTVVDWDEKTPSSGAEPEHPAPTLYINDPPPGTAAPTPGPSVSAATGGNAADGTADPMSGLGVGLGLAGLILGAIALVIAVWSVRRSRPAAGTDANDAPSASDDRSTNPVPEDD